MMTIPGSRLYDTRGCLALCLAVMQGMSADDAGRMAGTRATQGNAVRDTSQFTPGRAVHWRDKYDQIIPATILCVSRLRVRIAVGDKTKWITPNRLEVAP